MDEWELQLEEEIKQYFDLIPTTNKAICILSTHYAEGDFLKSWVSFSNILKTYEEQFSREKKLGNFKTNLHGRHFDPVNGIIQSKKVDGSRKYWINPQHLDAAVYLSERIIETNREINRPFEELLGVAQTPPLKNTQPYTSLRVLEELYKNPDYQRSAKDLAKQLDKVDGKGVYRNSRFRKIFKRLKKNDLIECLQFTRMKPMYLDITAKGVIMVESLMVPFREHLRSLSASPYHFEEYPYERVYSP